MQKNKKIGVFDSGLGGLFIADSIRKKMPTYDYVYLGDTLHLPYGPRSNDQIYDLSLNAMRYLMAQGCDLIVMACNTASAVSLRKLQQVFLANEHPHKRILGVVVPTLEAAIDHGATNIGMIATSRTVQSRIYEVELQKINSAISLHAVATPLLTPLIENGGEKYLKEVLSDYLVPIRAAKVESLILGCTHYAALKHMARDMMGAGVHVISQDEIIPDKLSDYLLRHADMEGRLSRGGTFHIHATDTNEHFTRNVQEILGDQMPLIKAVY